MEEKITSKSHKLMLNNRRNGSFTGILDVLSFDLSEILLETELGMLHIKGEIDAMTYSDVPETFGKGSGIFNRIFH